MNHLKKGNTTLTLQVGIIILGILISFLSTGIIQLFSIIIVLLAGSLLFLNLYIKSKRKLQTIINLKDDFNTAFEFAAIGMALVNENGRFTKVNKSLCKLLGYTPEELTNLTFQEITHAEDLDIDLEFMGKLNRGEIDNYQIEKRYFTKSGEVMWINLSGSKVLNSDGSFKHYIAQIQNITPRKRALKELEEQKSRIENILIGTNAGTWEWNVQTGETIFNERWAEMIGYTLDELQPVSIKTWENFAHPEDLKVSGQKLQACFDKKSPYYNCECRMKHKDGHWVWVLDRGKVITWTEDGQPLMMFGTHTDITENKSIELKLEELANKFSGIFNSTFQFIGFLSPEGILLEANQTAMDFAGLYKEDLIGKPFWECYWWTINEETQNYLKENIKRAAKGEFIQYEVEVLGKDSTVTIHFNLKPLFDDQGKVIAIIPEGRPIQDIVEARKALEMKNQELERFAHIASHDLKEPLRMVHNFMGLMEKNYAAQLDEKARKYIHFALDATQRMTILINDILEYAKIGADSTPFQKVDCNQLLDEIIPLFQAELEETNGKIQFQNLPIIISQRTPIKLLFQNLINNAIKYQKPANPPRIQISFVEHPDFWEFCVADNGIGIPEKYFQEIFSMFKRLHSKEVYTGTGMGLATCSKIVQQHGGEIWVVSEEGLGSKFFFTIKKYSIN